MELSAERAHAGKGAMNTMAITRPSQRLPIPAAIAEGGAPAWLITVVAGAALGAMTLVIPSLLDADDAFGFLAILLGMIAGVYLGFALQDGRRRAFREEYVGLVVHGAIAALALSLREPVLLAVGYFGHAVWDAIHHPRAIDTVIPRWYVPLCLGYDTVVGAYILLRFA